VFAAGPAPTGLYVVAALLGVLLVGESVASWLAHDRSDEPVPLEDDVEDAA